MNDLLCSIQRDVIDLERCLELGEIETARRMAHYLIAYIESKKTSVEKPDLVEA